MKFAKITRNVLGTKYGIRHVQTLLLFFNKFVIYYSRTHIPVLIVAMINAKASTSNFKVYKWNEKEKSYILSSLYWGSLIGQLPFGYLIRHYGVKINLFFVTLFTGIFNGLIPFCLDWGFSWQIFCFLRFMHGLFQSGSNPSTYQHLTNWSPPNERYRLAGFVYAGLDIGTVFSMSISGILCESSFFGWPGAIYMCSILCFLWCIFWFIFGANNPMESKIITEIERDYIVKAVEDNLKFKKENLPIPWIAMFSSIPFWALLIVRTTDCFGYYTVQNILPTYLYGIFNLDIETDGIFSALPYLASFIMNFVFMILAEWIRKRKLLSLTVSRKIFNSISIWMPAAGLIIIGFLDVEYKVLAIIIITITTGVTSAVNFGGALCCLELAPNFTEIIAVILDFAINAAILLGPLMAGWIINDTHDRTQWQIVFAIMTTISLLGDIIFLIFGSFKVQTWNEPEMEEGSSPPLPTNN